MGIHDVTIDEEAAIAAIDEIAGGGQPQGQGVGHLVITEPTQNEWLQIARMAAGMLANAVTPNWDVPADVREQWAEALAGCLDQLFPGGLANIANWGPWAKLAYASVMWGLCGIDYSNGQLKPLRKPKEGEETAGKGGHDREPSASVQAPPTAGGRHIMG